MHRDRTTGRDVYFPADRQDAPGLYDRRLVPARPLLPSRMDDLDFRRRYEAQYGLPWDASRRDTVSSVSAPPPNGNLPFPIRERQTRRKIVAIDSAHRDRQFHPYANEFRVELLEHIPHVRRIRLVSLEFPNTEQLIRSFPSYKRNNRIFWINNTVHERQVVYSATIDDGNYTIDSFVEGLALKLNNTERILDESNINNAERRYHNFTVTMDGVRSLFTLRQIERSILSRPFRCTQGSAFVETNHSGHHFQRGQLIYVQNSAAFGGYPESQINGQRYIDMVVETLDEIRPVDAHTAEPLLEVTHNLCSEPLRGRFVGRAGQRILTVHGGALLEDLRVGDSLRLTSSQHYRVLRILPPSEILVDPPLLPEDAGGRIFLERVRDLPEGQTKPPCVEVEPSLSPSGLYVLKLYTLSHRLRPIEELPCLSPLFAMAGLTSCATTSAEAYDPTDVAATLVDSRLQRVRGDASLSIYHTAQRTLLATLQDQTVPSTFQVEYLSRSVYPDLSFLRVMGDALDWIYVTKSLSGHWRELVFPGPASQPFRTPEPAPLQPEAAVGSVVSLPQILHGSLRDWFVCFDPRPGYGTLWALPPLETDVTEIWVRTHNDVVVVGDDGLPLRVPRPYLLAPSSDSYWHDLGFFDPKTEEAAYLPGQLLSVVTVSPNIPHVLTNNRLEIASVFWNATQRSWTIDRVFSIIAPLPLYEPLLSEQLVSGLEQALATEPLLRHLSVVYEASVHRFFWVDENARSSDSTWALLDRRGSQGDSGLLSAMGFRAPANAEANGVLWTFQAMRARHAPKMVSKATLELGELSPYLWAGPAFRSRSRGQGTLQVSSVDAGMKPVLHVVGEPSALEMAAADIMPGSLPHELVEGQRLLAETPENLPILYQPPTEDTVHRWRVRSLDEAYPVFHRPSLRVRRWKVQDGLWSQFDGSTWHPFTYPVLETDSFHVIEDGRFALGAVEEVGLPAPLLHATGVYSAVGTAPASTRWAYWKNLQILDLTGLAPGDAWLTGDRTAPPVTPTASPDVPGFLAPTDYSLWLDALGKTSDPYHLVVKAQLTREGLVWSLVSHAGSILPSTYQRASTTLPLVYGCVVDVLFLDGNVLDETGREHLVDGKPIPYTFQEALSLSTVPDGEHSYGQSWVHLRDRTTFLRMGEEQKQLARQRLGSHSWFAPFHAVQRFDLRHTSTARILPFGGVDVVRGSNTCATLARLFPYLPSTPGVGGISSVEVLLPALTSNATWLRTCHPQDEDRYFPVPAGYITHVSGNEVVAPGHGLREASAVHILHPDVQLYMVYETWAPSALTDEGRWGIFTWRGGQTLHELLDLASDPGDLSACLTRALQRILVRLELPTLATLARAQVNVTYMGHIAVQLTLSPVEVEEEWSRFLALAEHINEPSFTWSLWFPTQHPDTGAWMGHTAAAVWGFEPETRRDFSYVSGEDNAAWSWRLLSPGQPRKDPLTNHVAVRIGGQVDLVSDPRWSAAFWHAPLRHVDVTVHGPVVRRPFRAVPGSELRRQWEVRDLVVLGPTGTIPYRVLSFDNDPASPLLERMLVADESALVGLAASTSPTPVPTSTRLLRFRDADFRFRRFEVGDLLLPQELQTLECPYDTRYFPVLEARNQWYVVSVHGLCSMRVNALSPDVWRTRAVDAAWPSRADDVRRWQSALAHMAFFIKNDSRFYIQMAANASETRDGRGGNSVVIGAGVPFSLLFDRTGTPADIIGFPRTRLPFRTVHTNTVDDLESLQYIDYSTPGTGEKKLLTKVITRTTHGLEPGDMVYISGHRGSSNDDGVNSDEGHTVVVDIRDPPNVFYLSIQLERGGVGGELVRRRIYRPFSLGGDNYVFLCSPQLASGITTTKLVKNVFAKCMLNAPPGTVLFSSFVSAEKVFDEGALPSLTHVDLKVVDGKGEPYDFMNTDYSLTLEVEYEVDVVRGTQISSRTGM